MTARRVAAVIAWLPAAAFAGVFLDTDPGHVTHAADYQGEGGPRVLQVCLDPTALPISGDPRQATYNAIAEFNRSRGSSPNIASAAAAGLAADAVDYESLLLHELGHCVGLDHNVLGPSEVGCTLDGSCVGDPGLFHVNAGPGPNGLRDAFAGVDGARGTSDDLRLDDANRHWYRAGFNDPFVEFGLPDRSTHVQAGSLPVGETSAEAAASFNPCNQGTATSATWLANGAAPTMDVMFPVLCTANVVRRLSPNDRTTLRIARAGIDGAAGTPDDYSVTLVFQEQDQSGCDILVRFPSGGGFHCAVDLLTLPGGDTVVSDGPDADRYAGIINLQRQTKWHFNAADTTGGSEALHCDGFEDAPDGCDAL
jgi:hypothetical protein